MISEEQLQDWERLANEALGGKWRVSKIKSGLYPDGVLSVRGQDDVEVCGPIAKEDADFIAVAREAMPQLIAEVRRLRAELEKTSNERSDFGVIGYFQGRSDARDIVRQLEKESDWLAEQLKIHCCDKYEHKFCYSEKLPTIEECRQCWRKSARKAVQNVDN